MRKGFALAYGLEESPEPREPTQYGERWRPFRTVASRYMWRANGVPPGALPPQGRRGRGLNPRHAPGTESA